MYPLWKIPNLCPMPFVTDQLNRTIFLEKVPQRIISLVPSQTELLYDLGLDKEVIGITKFCIHPEKWFREKQRIGGTKTVNIEKIKSLEPDLIIANKEENVKDQIEELAKEFPVWTSDVNTLDGAYDMMQQIGELTGKTGEAEMLIKKIKRGFSQLNTADTIPGACYLIWREPYMTVGRDTFIHDMLTKAGFENIFHKEMRYPQVTIEDMHRLHCQLILLSSEPYPFKQKHVEQLKTFVPPAQVILVDGEMFSWYGSRLIHSTSYLEKLRRDILDTIL